MAWDLESAAVGNLDRVSIGVLTPVVVLDSDAGYQKLVIC
jgi:hypothetical protein